MAADTGVETQDGFGKTTSVGIQLGGVILMKNSITCTTVKVYMLFLWQNLNSKYISNMTDGRICIIIIYIV